MSSYWQFDAFFPSACFFAGNLIASLNNMAISVRLKRCMYEKIQRKYSWRKNQSVNAAGRMLSACSQWRAVLSMSARSMLTASFLHSNPVRKRYTVFAFSNGTPDFVSSPLIMRVAGILQPKKCILWAGTVLKKNPGENYDDGKTKV
jgi:hypothetical protein